MLWLLKRTMMLLNSNIYISYDTKYIYIYLKSFYKKKKKLNFLRYHKKFNPPCTITRPEIYPEFKIHLSTLTRGLNAHKYGNLNYWTHLHACYKRQKLTILCKYIGYYMTKKYCKQKDGVILCKNIGNLKKKYSGMTATKIFCK